MSSYVVITKNDFVRYRWNNGKYRRKNYKGSVFSYLREHCKIDKGVTLKDLFKIVKRFPELVQFINQYSWANNIEHWMDQAKIRTKMSPPSDYKYLRINHICDYDKELENEFGSYLGFDIVSKRKDKYGPVTYGLGGSIDSHIAGLPLKLDETYRIYDGPTYDNIKFLSKKKFTLLEVLDAIFWELSFYGKVSPFGKKSC